jgi:hypothetical protein
MANGIAIHQNLETVIQPRQKEGKAEQRVNVANTKCKHQKLQQH